ncbi:membrane lipoprotein TmpC precursor [Oxobacter pfennigii]|uniref:Membrane lipoprotein TmpC n=1 Tax=Oxobacter pfennigii TaxID=36849 RepID=A0A0P8WC24_9CLOT|nr:BMP family ABC transporter substrate-binding protein [Oxobacter pfennigii]KPU45266.1 membrane lipoprotein TmpC precursor [Oxobacter pfennigii]
MKRIISLLITVLMIGSLIVSCGQKPSEPQQPTGTPQVTGTPTPEKKMIVAMVTDTGGLGDKSFNDLAWKGITKFVEENGDEAESKVAQSKQPEDYQPNLTSMAEAGVDITFAVGYLFEKALGEVADANKDSKFAIIDTVVQKPNVASVTFKEHEGSFLVGVIAAKTTKTNKVGFVGGMTGDLIKKFETGFRAGVKAVNPEIQVLVNYTESFSDAAKGKEAALSQFNSGADVIYHASGGCGLGVIQAAQDKNLWAIGVDQDQSDLAPENVLCSMIKRVDTATYSIAKATLEGKFPGNSVTVLGLKEDGVGYSDNAGNTSAEAKELADKWAKAIVDGKVVVPEKEADLEGFSAKLE